MWKASSKITQQRIKQKNYQLHKSKVKSMKSLIKIRQPQQPDFVYAKWKLQLTRRQRRKQIQKDNLLLLHKINSISNAQYHTNKLRPQAQNLKTLNHLIMNNINQQITKENKRICQKLLNTHSYYPCSTILDHTNQLEKVCQNISTNARRAFSAKYSTAKRPLSGYASVSTFKRNNIRPNKQEVREDDHQEFNKEQITRYSSLRPQSAPTYKRLKKITLNPSGQIFTNHE